MTDAEIAEMEAELRAHKEERLRLRALEMRLSRELAEAKTLLREAFTLLAAQVQPYSDETLAERVRFLKQMQDALARGES